MATRLVLGLIAAAIAVASEPVLAGKPQVVVQFEIQVPAFQRNLPEQSQALQHVSSAIAAELARQYEFADWVTQAPAQSETQLGRLVVRMKEEQPRTQPSPRVSVSWFGSSSSTDETLVDLKFDPIEIYSSGNPNWDTNNRADFETRVLAKTMEKVRTDAFRDRFFNVFLANLPIASTIEPQAADRVIEIPVRWSDVLLASESVLTVKFNKQVDEGLQKGTLVLGQIVARAAAAGGTAASPEFPARLRGSVTKADFNGASIPLDTQNWNEKLLQVLGGAKAYCFISPPYKPRDELLGDSERDGL